MREADAAGVLTSDFAGFEEEHGLTEDLGQVGAMDLVADEESPAICRQPRGFDEPPGPERRTVGFTPERRATVPPESLRRSRPGGTKR
jgi:hypothetical protein